MRMSQQSGAALITSVTSRYVDCFVIVPTSALPFDYLVPPGVAGTYANNAIADNKSVTILSRETNVPLRDRVRASACKIERKG